MLYHGSPYGKETIPIYELLAEKYGFELDQIEVPHPGNEQQAQWLQIRREQPDYVVLRGWGVMNPVALKTAQRNGFPADHIIGNVWSNSEEDVRPGRRRGDRLHRDHHPGLGQRLSGGAGDRQDKVYGAGLGNLEDKKRIGSVYHNLGIVNGILNVEAVRIAQGKFGNRTLTGDEVRWGFEHLQLDPERVEGARAPRTCSTRSTSPGTTTRATATSPSSSGTAASGTSSPTGSRRTGRCCGRSSRSPSEAYAKEKGLPIRTAGGRGRGRHQLSAAAPPAGPLPAGAPHRGERHGRPTVLLQFDGVDADLQRRDRRAARRRPRGARRGEIVALLGANGAGKTTLLKAASNLLPAERGAVTAGQHPLLRPRRHPDRARATWSAPASCQVLEGRHCFRSLTVEENLVSGALAARREPRPASASDLDRVYALFPRLAEKRRVTSGPDLRRRAADDRDRPRR